MRSAKKAVGLLSVLLVVSVALSACPAPVPEVIEKEVTRVVQETVIVRETPQVIEKEVVVTATPEPKKKVLYLTSNEYPKALNPFLNDSAADMEPLYYVHCRLGQFGADLSVVPNVATWDQSADGLTYTFHIDPDAKWHDGEPVTAQDVVFTYRLVAHPESGAVYFGRMSAILGAGEFHEGQAEDIEGLQVIDEKTVAMTLKAPSPAFLPLTQGAIFLLPEHILGSFDVKDVWDAPYWQNPVGCGPYRWIEYVPDHYVHYERFADFHLGEPKIDEIYLRFASEEANAIAFERGEVDLFQLAGSDIERFSKMDFTLHKGGGTVESLVVNTQRPWLDNVKFRKAIMYALNREALNDAAWFGYGQVAVNPSVTPWTLSPNITQYAYDPDRAKELLAEIGWDTSVEFDLLVSAGVPYRDRMSVVMQQNLADVGIKINIVTMQSSASDVSADSLSFNSASAGRGVA